MRLARMLERPEAEDSRKEAQAEPAVSYVIAISSHHNLSPFHDVDWGRFFLPSSIHAGIESEKAHAREEHFAMAQQG